MPYAIEKLDHEDPGIRERIFHFLAPYEPYALFILGNLTMNFPDTHLYIAVQDGIWSGIAGYYAIANSSLIPFSRDPEVTRELTRYVATVHPDIGYVNGIDYAAEPAYDELLGMGYRPANDPQQIFMEMDGLPPLQPHEDSVRQMQPEDHNDIARLLRCLSETWDETRPVTPGEIQLVYMNPMRTVLLDEGRIVSSAATNGIGIHCYQILGVATHPEHRNRRYARAVVAALMRRMARLGGSHAVLFTNSRNTAAIQCYARLGFNITGKYYVAKLTH